MEEAELFLPSLSSFGGLEASFQALHELRAVLPDLVNSEGELRRPEQRILDLVTSATLRKQGLHVVEDSLAQPVLQKLGVPALLVAVPSSEGRSELCAEDIFRCLPLDCSESWWQKLFQLLLDSNPGVDLKMQPIWRLRGQCTPPLSLRCRSCGS